MRRAACSTSSERTTDVLREPLLGNASVLVDLLVRHHRAAAVLALARTPRGAARYRARGAAPPVRRWRYHRGGVSAAVRGARGDHAGGRCPDRAERRRDA